MDDNERDREYRARIRADDFAALGLIAVTFVPLLIIHAIALLWL